MTRVLVFVGFTLVLLVSTAAFAQDTHEDTVPRLSVPLLEGSPAPFSGLLITERHAAQCIQDAAAVARLQVESSVRSRQLTLSSSLYEAYIENQRKQIRNLRQTNWWDRNGTVFMFGVGLILGVVSSAVLVGLATN